MIPLEKQVRFLRVLLVFCGGAFGLSLLAATVGALRMAAAESTIHNMTRQLDHVESRRTANEDDMSAFVAMAIQSGGAIQPLFSNTSIVMRTDHGSEHLVRLHGEHWSLETLHGESLSYRAAETPTVLSGHSGVFLLPEGSGPRLFVPTDRTREVEFYKANSKWAPYGEIYSREFLKDPPRSFDPQH